LLHHLVNGHAVFQILEDDCHRRACALEHPSPADLAWDALNNGALGPIERGHDRILPPFSLEDLTCAVTLEEQIEFEGERLPVNAAMATK
jgi:hypothetical protein